MKIVFPLVLGAALIAAWPGFALRFFAALLLTGIILLVFIVLHAAGRMGVEQARAKAGLGIESREHSVEVLTSDEIPTLVYCTACNKTHAVLSNEAPCSDGVWLDATPIR